ncbi:dimethylamine monooxygenase subunit DmmA family protein [Fictibacillus nanhaiensis]|uniref:dimethylamine monooxygenase subunit DmmA family protein n=1 Tax=Fictibacillus nanhaiensis TaxID=742169 RepID=UPI003C1630F2
MRIDPVFIEGKRKYIFCSDEHGLRVLSSVFEHVKKEKSAYEWYHFSAEKRELLEEFLSKQKMGTFLYVVLPYSELHIVQTIAAHIGFSSDEAQFIEYSEKWISIFCCRCHELNRAEEQQTELTCHQCELKLEVSDHYSELHHAFLGYPAKS